jgi:DNA-binding XRE family transcriptional regulator/predicted DNA-binding protein
LTPYREEEGMSNFRLGNKMEARLERLATISLRDKSFYIRMALEKCMPEFEEMFLQDADYKQYGECLKNYGRVSRTRDRDPLPPIIDKPQTWKTCISLWREKLGMTQETLGKLMGVDKKHVANIESGMIKATAGDKSRLAKALGIPQNFLTIWLADLS